MFLPCSNFLKEFDSSKPLVAMATKLENFEIFENFLSETKGLELPNLACSLT